MGKGERAVEEAGARGRSGGAMKFLVVGDFMTDVYWFGTAERLSPEAPIPVVKVPGLPDYLPGGAGNVAENLKVLGAEVDVVGSASEEYPIKNRLMVGNTQVARWDRYDEQKPVDPERLKGLNVNRIVVADYGKGSIDANVCTALYEMNLPTFVDTKRDPSPWLGWTTAIFPNDREYCQFKSIYDRFERCVVTLGADGMDVLEFGKVIEHEPAFCERPICVNGAGDTVTAAYAYRWPRKDVAEFAALAAAIVVGKALTATATIGEINELRRAIRKSQRARVGEL